MTQTMQQPPARTLQGQPQYEITEADKKRVEKIEKAWQAYNGELAPPLKKMPDGTDPNVMSNRCVGVVDGGIHFLFGKPVDVELEEGAPQEAQDFLEEMWGRQEVRTPMLQKLAMNGALAGEAFLRIVPGDDQSPFRLVVLDPSTIFIKTSPQDCEVAQLFCIQYSCMEQINGTPREVFYREEICRIDPDADQHEQFADVDVYGLEPEVTWQIQHWTQVSGTGQVAKPTGWTPAGEPITWPYPFPPIFYCQNLPKANDFWGRADITPDIIGMNQSLNIVQSCIQLVQLLYGQPILYSTGTGEQTIDIRPGRIIGLPLPESKIVSVALANDTANALAYAQNLRSDIDEQSGVPGVATGRIEVMPRGNLSGIALELLFMPLLKKTESKRCTYGELLITVSKALLTLNNMESDFDISLAWQSPIPHDDLAAVQAAIAKKEIGLSNTTALRELGYDPDEELELNQAEDQANALNQQAMLPPEMPAVPALPGQPPPPRPPAQPVPQAGQPGSPFLGRGQ